MQRSFLAGLVVFLLVISSVAWGQAGIPQPQYIGFQLTDCEDVPIVGAEIEVTVLNEVKAVHDVYTVTTGTGGYAQLSPLVSCCWSLEVKVTPPSGPIWECKFRRACTACSLPPIVGAWALVDAEYDITCETTPPNGNDFHLRYNP